MQFSPDGKHLAAGYDDGSLIILDVTQVPWEPIRVYKTGATVRGLAWHPTVPTALIVGSGNGDINKLRFAANGKPARGDFTGLEQLTAFIHAIAINIDGSQITVAYGRRIVFIDTAMGFEMNWQVDRSDSIPTRFTNGTACMMLTVGDIQYIDNRTILASFVEPGAPFIAYSVVPPFEEMWKIESRPDPGIQMGHSAISQSNKSGIRILAVTNRHDGIDWYCLNRKRYMMSTQLILGTSAVMGIKFIDDMTVIAGQGNGKIAIATFGMAKDPPIFHFKLPEEVSFIQVRCLCGMRLASKDQRLVVAAAISTASTSKRNSGFTALIPRYSLRVKCQLNGVIPVRVKPLTQIPRFALKIAVPALANQDELPASKCH
ncbi:hypothetical protein BD779DRAFT_1677446 [Infundibulicybe gibba]|nr:hypothetical protein BD779DRAFT_1677446 [Infundibulicybe gibba]